MTSLNRSEDEQVSQKQASGSVLKALELVDVLAAAGRPVSLKELSARVGRPASTVHRLLRTLALRNYVESVNGSYRLTLKLLDLGTSVVSSLDVVSEARPACQALCDELEETVNVSVLSGSSVVYVMKLEAARSIRLISQLGMHAPVYCTAMGKVLLSCLDETDRTKLLDELELVPRAANTITDRAQFERELKRVTKRGWAVDNEEFDYGLVCVAATVFHRDGSIAAAVSVAGPAARMAKERWPKIGERVVATANAISARLGYQPPPRRSQRRSAA